MAYTLDTLILGPVQANCHIITDPASGETAVIDPGAFTPKLLRLLDGRRVAYILLTHRHYDHILGVAKLKELTGAKIAIHEADAAALTDPQISLAAVRAIQQTPVAAGIILRDSDRLPFGKDVISVIHTPGHTAGGVCYRLCDMLFTGDTLFKCDVGRTDLPSGDEETLQSSLKRLMALDFNGTVYPGHGEHTTLEYERANNPYI